MTFALKEHWHQLGGVIPARISIRDHCLDGAKTLSASLALSLLSHRAALKRGEREQRNNKIHALFSLASDIRTV